MYSFHLSYITFHVKIPDEKIIVEAMLKELLTISFNPIVDAFSENFLIFFFTKTYIDSDSIYVSRYKIYTFKS